MLKLGKEIGGYTLVEELGFGGNGVVWRVEKDHCQYAMKILKNIPQGEKSIRFKDEISIVSQEKSNKGILPILYYSLDKKTKWFYIMPIAEPVFDYIKKHKPKERVLLSVECILELAKTLEELHLRNIYHRDIKPSNIYKYNELWVLSDFGLVDYPGKVHVTGEKIGPYNTMAPEMRRNPSEANKSAADIYSLAKTLWILLTEDETGFDGSYHSEDSKIGLKNHISEIFIDPIDSLIEKATSNSPEERPLIGEFISILNKYKTNIDDFCTKNTSDWKKILKCIFPNFYPEEVKWTKINDIVKILKAVGSIESSNHAFLPGGGGLDLTDASVSKESECIELKLGSTYYVCKPDSLTFNSFGTSEEWFYFRLDNKILEPVLNNPIIMKCYEELVELTDGTYVSRYEAAEIASSKINRYVNMLLSGSIVIFSKSSSYNANSKTYDGRHNKMNASEFRTYIYNNAL